MGWALFGVWLAVTVVFLMFSLVEVDFLASSPSDRARIKNQLYLDEPIHERYGHFVWRLVKDQSTGQSGTGRDSGEIALEAVPAALVIPG